MSQRDLWEKAAECAQAIDATSDPTRREMLTHLQTLWTDLANESPFLNGPNREERIAVVEGLHTDLMQITTDNVTSPPSLHTPSLYTH